VVGLVALSTRASKASRESDLRRPRDRELRVPISSMALIFLREAHGDVLELGGGLVKESGADAFQFAFLLTFTNPPSLPCLIH
jgi:hypothetical protein